MTDLTDFRDHARKMAAFVDPRDAGTVMGGYCAVFRNVYGDPILEARHDQCTDRTCCCDCHPRDAISDTDRALFARLADEIDTYLEAADDDHPALEGM